MKLQIIFLQLFGYDFHHRPTIVDKKFQDFIKIQFSTGYLVQKTVDSRVAECLTTENLWKLGNIGKISKMGGGSTQSHVQK